eukprot:CAMPEP_0176503878 /NCGR_PEP_ID=MMETSP0200_2-20121128/15622_1 /TAXON_ID=947934 /ORGANISM="Chaetoceros sp., Strain GSL56" /LENGTH=840 /DNA_ID=CAMNT_0017903247 /DNA_START=22 /DNA_END=2544 /DNA_ORIENTATION=-
MNQQILEINSNTTKTNRAATAEELEQTTTTTMAVRVIHPSSPAGGKSSSSDSHHPQNDNDNSESERLPGVTREKGETPHSFGLTAKGYQRRFATHEYKDRCNEIIEPSTTKFERDAIKLYYSCQVTGPFPFKLQVLLRLVEVKNMQHIIGWQPHGRSFSIRNPTEFESGLMANFFAQTQLTSFRRQLNLYDFKRITHGPDSGSYYHELFLRGKPLHAYRIRRTKVKGTKYRSTSSPEDEPDFYSMPMLPPCFDAGEEQQEEEEGEEHENCLTGHLLRSDRQIHQQPPALPQQQHQWQQQSSCLSRQEEEQEPQQQSSSLSSLKKKTSAAPHPSRPTGAPGTARTNHKNSSGLASPIGGTNNFIMSPASSSSVAGDSSALMMNSMNLNCGGSIAGRNLPSMLDSSSNSGYGFANSNTSSSRAYPQQHQPHLVGTSLAGNSSNSNVLATLEQLRLLLGIGNNNNQQRNQHDLINEAIYSLLVNMTLTNDSPRSSAGSRGGAGGGIDISAILLLVQQEQQRRRQQQEQRDRQITELLASLSARNGSAHGNQRFDTNAFHNSAGAGGDHLLNYLRDNIQQQNPSYYSAAAPCSGGGSINSLLLSALLEQTYPSSDTVNSSLISPAAAPSIPNRNVTVQTAMGPAATPFDYDEARNSRNGVGFNDRGVNGIAGLGYLGRNLDTLETGRSSMEGQGLNIGADQAGGGVNLMHIMSAYNALHGNHGSNPGMNCDPVYNSNNCSYPVDHNMARSDMFNLHQGNRTLTEQYGIMSGSGEQQGMSMRSPLHSVGNNTASNHCGSYPDDHYRKDVQMQNRVNFGDNPKGSFVEHQDRRITKSDDASSDDGN